LGNLALGNFALGDLAEGDLAEADLAELELERGLDFALVFAAVAKWAESSLWNQARAGDPARTDLSIGRFS
jgi:hypothetical protein